MFVILVVLLRPGIANNCFIVLRLQRISSPCDRKDTKQWVELTMNVCAFV